MDTTTVVELASEVDGDLGKRINFLLEIDKLKGVLRRTHLIDKSRLENTAEHSWHLGMLVMVLHPHAKGTVDPARATAMLLVHDLVEIDAGDTFAYDVAGHEDKAEREQAAADRIFGLLPGDAGDELRALWDEYEGRETDTARFAYACDRLQPMILNGAAGGPGWMEHGIVQSQVRSYNAPIEDGSADLWALAQKVIGAAVDDGHLGVD